MDVQHWQPTKKKKLRGANGADLKGVGAWKVKGQSDQLRIEFEAIVVGSARQCQHFDPRLRRPRFRLVPNVKFRNPYTESYIQERTHGAVLSKAWEDGETCGSLNVEYMLG